VKRYAHPIDPANLCECGHLAIALSSGTRFCPCEDCHIGGLVQGREARPATGNLGTESVTAWTGLDDHDAMVRKGLADDVVTPDLSQADDEDVATTDWLHQL
jgi:hypothetical protein